MKKVALYILFLLYSGVVFSQSPGGISLDLTFWYKSDAGTTPTTDGVVVTSWNDQTANAFNATEITTGPTYTEVFTNFNPAINFSNATGGFAVPDDNLINTSTFTGKSYTIAFKTGSDVSTKQMLYEQGGGGTGMNLYIDGSSLIVNLWNTSVEYNGSVSIAANTSYVFSYTFDGGNTRIDGYLNGTQVITNVTAPTTLNNHGGDPGMGIVNGNTQYVGDIGTSGLEAFGGYIMEMAYYNNHVYLPNELNQVESYMALKYGILLSSNYTASDGVVVPWHTGTNAGYTANVTGIGRDDNSLLNQKQSLSETSDGLITMGLGSIETNNATNSNLFTTDKDFMMWGNNGGALSFTSTGAPTGKQILSRQWKIQETATTTVGTVKFSIPSSSSSATNKLPAASTITLFIDSDGDFSTGSTPTTMVLNGDNWEANVNFDDGDYFTFSIDGASISTTTNGQETGPVNIVFTVTLASVNSTGSPITFDIDDAGTGSASAGLDYTDISPSAQISVADGSQTGTFIVVVADDALQESLETLEVTISNPSNPIITIGTSSAIATITDNDASIPGGVASADLVFWLKANEGTSTTTNGATVASWIDQSSNGNTATEISPGPTYTEILDNFNPAFNFTSITGGLGLADDAEINTGGSNFTAKSYSIVFKTGSDITTRQVAYEQGGSGTGMNLYIESGSLIANLYRSNIDYSSSTSVAVNTTYVVSFVYDGTNTRWDMYLNGTLATSATSVTNTFSTHTGDIGIGVINTNTQFNGGIDVSDGESFLGHIAEMAYYNDIVFTPDQRNQIESYLGLKYGTSLSSDYLASDGLVTYWDASDHSGYTNRIAGIGLDEETALDRKQAKSNVSDALITVGLGTIETTNEANTNAFAADKSFMLWGSDNGALTFSTTGAPSGVEILGRSWKIEETATVGTVKIQVPDNTSTESTKLPVISTLNLLQDADGVFSSGANSTSMTLNGTNWEVDVDFSDGEFFTFTSGGADLSVTTNGSETGPTNIVYTVTLLSTNTSGSSITFDISDAGTGSATSGDDYTAISGSAQITIPNNSQTGTFTVVVSDDAIEEGTETIDLTISNPNPSSVSIGTATTSASITDDDFSLPGGISGGLTFWLKSDKGVTTASQGSTVTAMIDQSFNGNDASEFSPGPTYDEVLTNFNPGIEFASVTGGLSIGNDDDINSSNSTAKSYSIVFRTGSDISTRQVIYEQGGATNGLNLYIESNVITANIWVNSVDNAASTSTISTNTDYIFTYVYNGSSGRWDGYLNGSLAMSDNAVFSTLNSHTGLIGVGIINNDTQFDGGIDVASGEEFLGQIMEMIYYNEVSHIDGNRNRIESYLALKFGITYDEDYIASDGLNTYWDAATNSTYHNDVSGIGRDGTGGLEHKQSKSVNSDAIVTIGLGSIAASNSANTGVFASNDEFLVWGNDNGSLAGESSNSGLTAESGVADQLQRTWQVIETGTVPQVQVAFPKSDIDGYFSLISFGGITLRVADNPTFTSNIQDIVLSEIDINGVTHYAANVTFSGTQYFTVVQTGFILWNGSEWRGGLSAITDHGPSDETGDASKNLFIQSGSVAVVSEGVGINNIQISTGATLTINPTSCLIVNGTMSNSGTLNFEADATGYAQYKGPAVSAKMEQYIDTEGWHNIGSAFSDVVWNDISFLNDNGQLNHPLDGASLDSCNYCNVWYYDPSTDIGQDIGFGSSTAYGTWRSSTDGSQDFDPDRGWNLYLDASSNFGTDPWTISITDVFNTGNINQVINENNGGWNLVANPYPSVLDWDIVDDDLASANIALGYHVWDEANTIYATYASGVGTSGATQYIAPFQGYYVQTATAGGQNSGDVFRSFGLTNADRPDPCQSSNFYKTQAFDLIRIKTTHLSSGKKDETVLKFTTDASSNFKVSEDIRKLFSPNSDVASVYAKSQNNYTAINTLPYPIDEDNVLLGVNSANSKDNTIEITEVPSGWSVYLEDLKDGVWHNILASPYTFTQDNQFSSRFLLHYSMNDFNVDYSGDVPFTAYTNGNILIVEAQKSMINSDWQLSSITGALLQSGSFNLFIKDQQELDIQNLNSGIYFLTVKYANKVYTQKVPILN